MSDFSKEILKQNLIYQIRQFNQYAELYPLERANFVIDLLNELLIEANKCQTEWSMLDEEKPL